MGEKQVQGEAWLRKKKYDDLAPKGCLKKRKQFALLVSTYNDSAAVEQGHLRLEADPATRRHLILSQPHTCPIRNKENIKRQV